MKISNEWVGYSDRSAEQVKATVEVKLAVKLPEMTDRSPNNPLIKLLDVWYGIQEHLNYYLDNKGREPFLAVCRRFKSAALIAQQFNYRIKGAGAATTDLTFSIQGGGNFSADVTIPAGTEIQTGKGVRFFTLSDLIIITGQASGTVTVEQAIPVNSENVGVSTGTVKQKFSLAGKVVDASVSVNINGVQWTPVETFAFSSSADTHFIAGLDNDGVMKVFFGDGNTGAIPTVGQDVYVSYKTTDGLSGNNVAAGSINNIISVIVAPGGETIVGTNTEKASGGYDQESLQDLKHNIPIFIRTLDRAVTKQDYIDLATLTTGVAKAGVNYTCGKFIDVYIAPEGGGLPSTALIGAVQDYLDDRKMITTNVAVKGAGVVAMKLVVDVFLHDGFVNSEKKTELQDAALTFLSVDNQDISGNIELGDLYQLFETTKGVKHSRIKEMKVVPYARPTNTTLALSWTRNIQAASNTTVRWRIVFTSATEYQLMRETSYLGTFTTGDQVIRPEIIFTVNAGAYLIGMSYEFYTYKSFGSVRLIEPSYIQSASTDLVINVFGGIM